MDFSFITFNPTAGSPPGPYQYWDILFYVSGGCIGCAGDNNIFDQIITRREKQRRRRAKEDNDHNAFPFGKPGNNNPFSPESHDRPEIRNHNKENDSERGRAQSFRKRRAGVGPKNEDIPKPCPECPTEIEDLRGPTQDLVEDLFQQYALELLDIEIASIGEVEPVPCPSNMVPVQETIEIPLSALPREEQPKPLNLLSEKMFIENAIVESYDTLARRDFCDPQFLELSRAQILNYIDDDGAEKTTTTLLVEVEGTYRDYPPSFFSSRDTAGPGTAQQKIMIPMEKPGQIPSYRDESTSTCYCPIDPIGYRAPSMNEFINELQTHFIR